MHCFWKNFTFLTFLQELYTVIIIMWVGKCFSSLPLVDWLTWTLVLSRRGNIRVNIVVVCAFVNSSKTTIFISSIFTSSFHTFLIVYACYSTHTYTHKKITKWLLIITLAPPLKAVWLHSHYIKPTFHDPFNSRWIIQFCAKLYPSEMPHILKIKRKLCLTS